MQCIKESVAGNLYIQNMYSYGCVPKQTSTQREERKKVTTEHKNKINKVNKKYRLMKLLCSNFTPYRDLFVCLGYSYDPTDEEVKTSLRLFHRKMKEYMKRRKVTYKYIVITETHKSNGEPVRVHHHVIMSGCGKHMLGRIMDMWGQGSVDVRMLKELTDNFEDTANYLLKENKNVSQRAYSTSHNLIKPEEPTRRIVPESAEGFTPPGVRVVTGYINDSGYGRYEIRICKIIDHVAFNEYFEEVKKAASRQASFHHYVKSKYR